MPKYILNGKVYNIPDQLASKFESSNPKAKIMPLARPDDYASPAPWTKAQPRPAKRRTSPSGTSSPSATPSGSVPSSTPAASPGTSSSGWVAPSDFAHPEAFGRRWNESPSVEPHAEEPNIARDTYRALLGDETSPENGRVKKAAKRMREELEYSNETGEALAKRNEVVETPWTAPVIARDAEGNTLRDADGRPIIGETSDPDEAAIYNQEVLDAKRRDISRQLDEAYAERERLQGLLESRGNLLSSRAREEEESKPLWQRALEGFVHAEQPERFGDGLRLSDADYQNLQSAFRQNERRIASLEAERDDGGVLRGMSDTFSDPSFYSLGLTDVSDMSRLSSLKAKIDNAHRLGVKPEFSESEQALVQGVMNNDEAQRYMDNRGWGYNFGRGFAETLGFMGEFALSGGFGGVAQSGVRAGTKAGLKLAGSALGKYLTKNIGSIPVKLIQSGLKGAGRLSGATAGGFLQSNTAGIAHTWSDIMEKNLGHLTTDKRGELTFEGGESLGRSILLGQLDAIGENASELIGPAFDFIPGYLGRVIRNKVGSGAIDRFLNNKWMRSGNKLLRYTGINGVFGEGMEEEANMLGSYIVGKVFDDDSPERHGLLDLRQQLDTWATVGLTGGLLRAPQSIASGFGEAVYYGHKYNLHFSDRRCSDLLGSDRWGIYRDELDNSSNKDIGSTLFRIINEPSLNREERQAVFTYAHDLVRLRGHNLGSLCFASLSGEGETPVGHERASSFNVRGNVIEEVNDLGEVIATHEYEDEESRKAGHYELLSRRMHQDMLGDIASLRTRNGGAYDSFVSDFCTSNGISVEDLNGMIERDPLEWSDGEQQLMVSFAKSLHSAVYDNSIIHTEESMRDGQSVSDAMSLDIESPDVSSADGVVNDWLSAQQAREELFSRNEALAQEVQTREDAGMSPQEIISSLDTFRPDDVQTLINYYNQRAKYEGFVARTKENVANAASNSRERHTFKGTINGNPETTNLVMLVDSNGDSYHLVSGDVSVDSNGNIIDSGSGLLLAINSQGDIVSLSTNSSTTYTIQPSSVSLDEFEQQEQERIGMNLTDAIDGDGLLAPAVEPQGTGAEEVPQPTEQGVADDAVVNSGTGGGEAPATVPGTPAGEDAGTATQEIPTDKNGVKLYEEGTPIDAAIADIQADGFDVNEVADASIAEAQQAIDKINKKPTKTRKDLMDKKSHQSTIDYYNNVKARWEEMNQQNIPTIVSDEDFNINDLDFENNYYVIHQTLDSNVDNIINNGLRTASGLNGTSLFGNRESIESSLNAMREGRGHRGSTSLIILRFPKSEFGDNVRNVDDFSMQLYENGKAQDFTIVPTEYIDRVVQVKPQQAEQQNAPEWRYDKPEDARERGYKIVEGNRIDRQEEKPMPLGMEVEVQYSTKDKVKGRMTVSELGEVQGSHLVNGQRNEKNFIPEAQPKAEFGADRQAAAQSNASEANFRPELMLTFNGVQSAYSGSTTQTNRRGEVIQGNGRRNLAEYIYAPGNEAVAKRYKEFLMAHAAELGTTADAIAGMDKPFAHIVLDVPDAEAIRLGQFTAQDLETGGKKVPEVSSTVMKMGDRFVSFTSVVLRHEDPDASLAERIEGNLEEAVSWLNRGGYINNTEAKTLLEDKSAARQFLKDVLTDTLFSGASPDLRTMFYELPKNIQSAIVSVIGREVTTTDATSILKDIQESIQAYHELMVSSSQFAGVRGRNYEERKRASKSAVSDWLRQINIDGSLNQGKYSNFALELAMLYRSLSDQKTLATRLRDYYDLLNGATRQLGMFDDASSTGPLTREEAIKQLFGVEYGRQRTLPLAGDVQAGEGGQQGGPDRHQVGERGTVEGRPSESGRGDTGDAEVVAGTGAAIEEIDVPTTTGGTRKARVQRVKYSDIKKGDIIWYSGPGTSSLSGKMLIEGIDNGEVYSFDGFLPKNRTYYREVVATKTEASVGDTGVTPTPESREDYLASHPLTEAQIMADTEATEDEKLNAIDFLRGEDDSAISRFYYDSIYERAQKTSSSENRQKKEENEPAKEKKEEETAEKVTPETVSDHIQINNTSQGLHHIFDINGWNRKASDIRTEADGWGEKNGLFYFKKSFKSGRGGDNVTIWFKKKPNEQVRQQIEQWLEKGKRLDETDVLARILNGEKVYEVEPTADPMQAIEDAARLFRGEQKSQDQQDIDDALKEFNDFLDGAKGSNVLDKFMRKGLEGNDKAQSNLLDAFTLTNEAQRMFLKDLLRLASKVGYAYIKSGVHEELSWSKKMFDSIGAKLKEVLGWEDALISEFTGEVWNQKYTADGQRMRLREHAERLKNNKPADNSVNVNKTENNETENVVSSQSGAEEVPQRTGQLEGDSAEFAEKQEKEKAFRSELKQELLHGVTGERTLKTMQDVKKVSEKHGLNMSMTDLQEIVEAVIVDMARGYANNPFLTDKQKFDNIVALYETQPTLNARDNDRINKQQYSTPAPMAFLMGRFVMNGSHETSGTNGIRGLEPSAGNGMLTIALPKEGMHVNDIDEMRLSNLAKQGFGEVTSQDGTQPFGEKKYDVVVTNPPFGSVPAKTYDGLYEISGLEHQMAINALESMKDDGRAAIIIGGNTEYNQNGTIKGKDRAFLNYLYAHYNVVDVINMDGKTLYSRQGTGFPVRMILINGRKEFNPRSYAPVIQKARAERVNSYDELYKRVNDDILSDSNKSAGVHDTESGESGRVDDTSNAGVSTQTGVRTVRGKGGSGQRELLDSGRQPVSGGVGSTPGGTDIGTDTSVGKRGDVVHGTGSTATQPSGSTPSRTGSQRDLFDGGNDSERPDGRVDASVGAGQRGTGTAQSNDGAAVVQQHTEQKAEVKRGLGTEKVPYRKQSGNPFTLQSLMPAEQADVVKKALEELGDVDQFLVDELGYSSKEELHQALAAEQIDSVAMAIHQMNQGNAFIIGDQTGIGKGRQAAALIRYGVKKGGFPVFITVKKGLFSDMYRDLCDIGSPELRPFIWSADDTEHSADVTDKDGNVVYKRPSDKEQKRVVDYINKYGKLPPEYDYIITTYDSFKGGTMVYEEGQKKARNFGKKQPTTGAYNSQAKRDALEVLSQNSFVIMDESHNAGGEGSAVSGYLQYITAKAKGVTFLSATFAKRPGNMPIYSLKTAISKAGVKVGELIDAVKRGGATFQEIMSKALTEAGQMIRRERDMTGVTIDWKGIEDEAVIEKQRQQYDTIIGLFNDIIDFQRRYVDPIVNKKNDEAADEQGEVDHTPGTRDMGINNTPFASRTYNMVQQVLLSLKAEETAKRAIEHLKAGRKPVIALANTNEGAADEVSTGEDMEMPDLSVNLKKGLQGTLRITRKDAFGSTTNEMIPFDELSEAGQARYREIMDAIENASSGLSLSPIDVIKNELKKAGYKVGELTGRKQEFVYNDDGTVKRIKRQDSDKKRTAADFNSGKLDVLILNKSAGTGISLHASSKFDDQRQRVMIVAQAQGDVNDEVQIRGRIDRTGQVLRGMYEYVVSQIPSEQRLLMMLKAKLRSLDANTTSSQKSKFNEMQVQDIINKYGDDIVIQYLAEHPDLAVKMVDPLKWTQKFGDGFESMGAETLASGIGIERGEAGSIASKVLGRMALLTVSEQEKMLQEIGDLYQAEIDRLNEMGENDLEITEMPLRAKTLKKDVWEEGVEPGGNNPFADNSYVEEVEMDVLRKPMKAEEVKKSQARLLSSVAVVQPHTEHTWENYKQVVMERLDAWEAEKKKDATDTITARAEKKAQAEKEKYAKGAKKSQDKNGMTDAEIEKNAQYQYDTFYHQEMDKLQSALDGIDKQKQSFVDALETFTTDGVYALPTDIYDLGQLSFDPSFGKVIDIKITDNFSTAASTITFATLDGRRKITIPISGMVKQSNGEKRDIKPIIVQQTAQVRNGMFGSNIANTLKVLEQNVDNWDKLTSTATRKKGYIITGNLLKALTSLQKQHAGGKLISYTTDTGEIRQGVLMSDQFNPGTLTSQNPISTAKADLDDYGKDRKITSADGDVTIKTEGYASWKSYSLKVPKSKKKGEKFFNDKVLLSLMDGQFEGSSNMRADFKKENLDAVLKRLDELGVTVESAKDDANNDMNSGYSEDLDEMNQGYSEETDEEVIERLEKEPKIKVYRAMQLIDGKLYPPMAAKQGGKLVNPIELGKWEKADEHPEMADENGKFKLDKGNGKSLKAAYNPYIHTSTTMLNDQFSEAQSRPNLVVVEVEVPESELTSGYKAEKAKDAVGRLEWKAGIIQGQLTGTREVILSRWDKPVRIVPTEEVAKSIAKQIKGKVEVMPTNVVTPAQREALEKEGVKFVETDNRGKIVDGPNKGKTYSSVYGKKAKNSGYSEGEAKPQPTRHKENIRKHVEKLLNKLGTRNRTTVITSINGVRNKARREHIENMHKQGKKVYGWFENGRIYLYLPDIDSIYKAEQTIWHETVAHVGLRELLGAENYGKLLNRLWMQHKDGEMGEWVTRRMQVNGWSLHKAIDEWLAREAEKVVAERQERRTLWQKLAGWVGDILREIGYRTNPTITDVRYLFWLSENQLREGEPMTKIRQQAFLFNLERQAANTPYIKDYTEEERSIMDSAKRNGTFMKAPNGNPTNLTERQWLQVRTKNFINWFGDWINDPANASKVVDENGEPLVVYHGSPKYFSEFRNKDGEGIHFFTTDRKYAERYSKDWLRRKGYMMPVFLNIRNPKRGVEKLEHLKAIGIYNEEKSKRDGFDGIEGHDVKDILRSSNGTEYVVFKANQIKSATDNNGEFSTKNDDIGYSEDIDDPIGYSEKAVYDDRLNRVETVFTEAYQDSMIALKTAQNAIAHDEDILDSQNAYQAENLMHGRVKNAQDLFNTMFRDPLVATLNKIMNATGMNWGDIDRYVFTKHGLERNREFFVRDWLVKQRGKKVRSYDDLSPDAQYIYDRKAESIEELFEEGTIESEEQKEKALRKALQESHEEWLADIESGWQRTKRRASSIGGTYTFVDYLADLNHYIEQNIDEDYIPSEHDYSGFRAMYGDEKGQYDEDDIIDELMNTEDAIDSDDAMPHLTEQLWEQIRACTRYGLEYYREAGMRSDEEIDNVEQMFHWYVPMRGFKEKTGEDMYQYFSSKGKPSNTLGGLLKHAKGRGSEANFPIATIFSMTYKAISDCEQNLVNQHLYRLCQSHKNDLVVLSDSWLVLDDEGNWVEEYPEYADDMSNEELREATEAFEERMQSLQKEGKAKRVNGRAQLDYRPADPKKRDEHIVEVRINGRKRLMIVTGNPRMAQALNGQLRFERGNTFLSRWNSWIKNLMSSLFTSYSPTFAARNMSRDWTHFRTMLSVREGEGYASAANGYYLEQLPKMMSLFRKYRSGQLDLNNEMERDFKEFMDEGGITGFVHMQKVDDVQKELDKLTRQMKDGKVIKLNNKVWEKTLGMVEAFNEAIENNARFATYRSSRHYAGRTRARSAYDAKEITVNFNRKGAGGKSMGFKSSSTAVEDAAKLFGVTSQVLGEGRIFFNATVQAIATTFKNFQHSDGSLNGKYIARWALRYAFPPFMFGLLLPMINKMLFSLLGGDGDDDPYANLPEWTRRKNICFYIGGDDFLTIPIGQELSAFLMLGDLLAGMTYAPELKPIEKGFADEMLGFLTTFSPVDIDTKITKGGITGDPIDETIGRTFSVLAPIVAVEQNIGWTGRPVYREDVYDNDEKKPEYQRVYSGTNPLLVEGSRLLHEWTGGNDVRRGAIEVNPGVVQYLWEQYSGGPGKFLSNSTSAGRDLRDWLRGEETEFNIRKIEMVKAFIQQGDDRTQYYRTLAKWRKYRSDAEDTEYELNSYKKMSKDDPLSNIRYDALRRGSDYTRMRIVKDADKVLKKMYHAADEATGSERKRLRRVYNEKVKETVELLENVPDVE